MKRSLIIGAVFCAAGLLFAQDFSDLSDDELFGGDSETVTDDDIFFDDGIEELTTDAYAHSGEGAAKADLRKGGLYESGSIKIGGKFSSSLQTSTTVYSNDGKDSGDYLSESTLTPSLSAYLSVDARPTQTLRMYSKFGMEYPFANKATTYLNAGDISTALENYEKAKELGYDASELPVTGTTSISSWFNLKELFTDFSVADRVFFRFGLHTVTWGTGYFFSPVSDMINTSSINPEDTDAQVDGALNLRTQITFPDSQNCLWLYLIPSTDFTSSYTAASYLKDTGLAGKYELVLGGWELGLGGFWQWTNAPKLMATASGSIKNINLFGEAVYSYGAASEWNESSGGSLDWNDKTSIFQVTAGASYYWKTPAITAAAQYYYDGNNKDLLHKYMTYGHNAAAVVSFGRIFGTTDVTATVFGMVNFGKEELPSLIASALESYGISSYLNAGTFSAMLNYSPVSEITVSAGPYVTFQSFDQTPVVSLKLNFTLGGGKF